MVSSKPNSGLGAGVSESEGAADKSISSPKSSSAATSLRFQGAFTDSSKGAGLWITAAGIISSSFGTSGRAVKDEGGKDFNGFAIRDGNAGNALGIEGPG